MNYLNSNNKVTIICKKHGEFSIQPNHHLEGCGCQKCSRETNAENTKSSALKFIEKARGAHGDKYDYSKVEYINAKTKVCIVCPKHGEFWQTPNDHLNGKGCSKCNYSKLEEEVDKLLTENKIDFIQQKQFEWLGNKRLDFYLPEYNVAIECQGIQHFKPVEHFGGVENLRVVEENDKLKMRLCKEHNIEMIYYSNLNIDYPYEVITNNNVLIKKVLYGKS